MSDWREPDRNSVPAPIERHADPRRINGLIWEDRVRTTQLFRPGNIAEHPTSPTDIAPIHDMIQELPTHVKSTKSQSVDMACSYRLLSLKGHQRLVVGHYTLETHYDDNGHKFEVYCYYAVSETILSPVTLEALRGEVKIEEIKYIRDELAEYDIDVETLEDARTRFHAMTKAIRPRMGIAKSSAKLSIDNNRLQASVSMIALKKQMVKEGHYHGRIVQVNHETFTKEFYGLKLPWRTTAKEHIFKPIRYNDSPKRRRKKKGRMAPSGSHAQYVGQWIGITQIPIAGGALLIMRHEDDKRTIRAESPDDDVRRNVSRACKAAGGEWIEAGRCWLTTFDQARTVVESLEIKTLPTDNSEAVLTQVGDNPNLFQFNTVNGPVRTLRLPSDNWALLPQGGQAVAERIDAACRAAGIGKYYESKQNWLIPQEPPEMIEIAARAIQEFEFKKVQS